MLKPYFKSGNGDFLLYLGNNLEVLQQLDVQFALMSYNSKMHSRWQAKEKEKEKQAA